MLYKQKGIRMNTNVSVLEQQAIQAAKTQDWPSAIDYNTQIIEMNPEDVGGLIRLGVAYAQVGNIKEAKKLFTQTLEIDKSNSLAKKHLQKLNNKQTISLSTLPADEQFIEEPGKTKTVELHRLAGKDQLDEIAIGQSCQLKSKNRFISVEVGKTYVGSLPEDLSARLAKLMKSGNEYSCYIRAISSTSCSVFLKETVRSTENEFVNSFPVQKSQLATINDMFLADENIALQMEDDYIPPQIVDTDTDEEKTLDSLPMNDDQHYEETPVDDSDE
jgi:tetratricopeptide (TPR) repeat protein